MSEDPQVLKLELQLIQMAKDMEDLVVRIEDEQKARRLLAKDYATIKDKVTTAETSGRVIIYTSLAIVGAFSQFNNFVAWIKSL
jgi:hypothetical protein